MLTSDKGAVGALQLKPATARAAATWKKIPWDEKKFWDTGPEGKAYNRQIAAAELERLLTLYHGDKALAAAGYNGGEGNVAHWLRRSGDRRTGKIDDLSFAKTIPFKETRHYVLRSQFGWNREQLDLLDQEIAARENQAGR